MYKCNIHIALNNNYMTKLTLEDLQTKGIFDIPTDKSIITKDGQLYILLEDGLYVETGVVALDVASNRH